jgi:hypothetical protein
MAKRTTKSEEPAIPITQDIAKARRFDSLEAARAFIRAHQLEGAACVPTASDPDTLAYTEWAISARAYVARA